MTANPELVKMIADWRRLDAEADRLYRGGKADSTTAGDVVQDKATALIHAIGGMEATSAADIMLKLDLACQAYEAATQDRDKFIEAGEPPLDFLFQSILTVALPVTSQVVQGDISETARDEMENVRTDADGGQDRRDAPRRTSKTC